MGKRGNRRQSTRGKKWTNKKKKTERGGGGEGEGGEKGKKKKKKNGKGGREREREEGIRETATASSEADGRKGIDKSAGETVGGKLRRLVTAQASSHARAL